MATATRTPQKIAFQSWLLGDIIGFAYELPLDRIERRPQWMYAQCFDVAVTTSAPASLPEQKQMLRTLLEERFRLVTRRTSYPSPVYFLVPGPQQKLTEAAVPEGSGTPEFSLFPLSVGSGRSSIYAPSVNDLTVWLAQILQLPVIDKTGATGLFDIAVGLPVRPTESGVSAAVRSALGLELERHQGTAESLLIDRVQQARN